MLSETQHIGIEDESPITSTTRKRVGIPNRKDEVKNISRRAAELAETKLKTLRSLRLCVSHALWIQQYPPRQ